MKVLPLTRKTLKLHGYRTGSIFHSTVRHVTYIIRDEFGRTEKSIWNVVVLNPAMLQKVGDCHSAARIHA